MQSEFKHKERTTKRNKLIEGDPISQFKEKMNAVLNNNDELKDNINMEYLENCIDNIHYSNPEKSIYLNAVAFIFGFYILKNKKIDKEKFQSLDKFKDLMEENFISPIDVIRYARYFIINNEFMGEITTDVNKNINENIDFEDDENIDFEDDEDNNFDEDEDNNFDEDEDNNFEDNFDEDEED
jgi:hypothetical protein